MRGREKENVDKFNTFRIEAVLGEQEGELGLEKAYSGLYICSIYILSWVVSEWIMYIFLCIFRIS